MEAGANVARMFSKQTDSFDYADRWNGKVGQSTSVKEPAALAKRLLPECWEALAKSMEEHRALNEQPEENESEDNAPLEKQRQCGSYLANFCTEIQGRNGNWYRSYIAATYSSVLSMSTENPNPHLYEVIRDGCPCHLYFDLEYCKQSNPSVEGEELVDGLLCRLDGFLQ